jgi:hypothetical protein
MCLEDKYVWLDTLLHSKHSIHTELLLERAFQHQNITARTRNTVP